MRTNIFLILLCSAGILAQDADTVAVNDTHKNGSDYSEFQGWNYLLSGSLACLTITGIACCFYRSGCFQKSFHTDSFSHDTEVRSESDKSMEEAFPNLQDGVVMLNEEDYISSEREPQESCKATRRRISDLIKQDFESTGEIGKYGSSTVLVAGFADETLHLEEGDEQNWEFDAEGRGFRRQLSVCFAKETFASPRVSILVSESPKVNRLRVADKQDLCL